MNLLRPVIGQLSWARNRRIRRMIRAAGELAARHLVDLKSVMRLNANNARR